MLIPVSFIVINSIRAVNGSSVDEFTNQKTDLAIYDTAPIGTSSGLISELLEHWDCKPMQLRCRVSCGDVLRFLLLFLSQACIFFSMTKPSFICEYLLFMAFYRLLLSVSWFLKRRVENMMSFS